MAIQIFDPDERRRNNKLASLQGLQTFGSLMGNIGTFQKSQQEATLAKQQAALLSQFLPQLPGSGNQNPTQLSMPGATPSIAGGMPNGIGLTGFGIGPTGMSMNFGQTPQAESEQKLKEKRMESSEKLTRAIKTMASIKKKYDEAFPNVEGAEELPLLQRVEGFRKSVATKTGLEANPKVTSLERQAPLYARLIIRDFGEVGNIPTSDVNDAVKSVKSEGQTEKERNQVVADFVDVAISRLDEDSRKALLADQNVQDILETVGVKLDQYGINTALRGVPPAIQQALEQSGMKIKSIREKKSK